MYGHKIKGLRPISVEFPLIIFDGILPLKQVKEACIDSLWIG